MKILEIIVIGEIMIYYIILGIILFVIISIVTIILIPLKIVIKYKIKTNFDNKLNAENINISNYIDIYMKGENESGVLMVYIFCVL